MSTDLTQVTPTKPESARRKFLTGSAALTAVALTACGK